MGKSACTDMRISGGHAAEAADRDAPERENGMITSLSNSRVKNVTALNRKAKKRKSQGKYVVEGIKMFLEAPEAEIEEIYVSESFEEGCGKNPHAASCLKKLGRLSFETVSDEVFAKMSDTEAPQGILCVMKKREYSETDILSGAAPLDHGSGGYPGPRKSGNDSAHGGRSRCLRHIIEYRLCGYL